KNRLLDPQCDGADNGRANVGCIEVLLVKFPYTLYDALAKSREVGTALGCILSVYKRVVLFTVLVAVSQGNLDVVSLQMDNRVPQFFGVDLLLQQVEQAVLRV